MKLSAKLKDFWQQLRQCDEALNGVELSVRKQLQPEIPEGRRTYFGATKRFTFQPNEFVPKTFPLVHSAGSVTRVVRLSYEVEVQFAQIFDVDPVPFWIRNNFRVNPRVLVAEPDGFADRAFMLFDFEWNYSLGSTQKNYGQQRGNDSPPFLSRKSLGNPENNNQLLFSEKNPLVLDTNEFLNITINPIFMFFDTSTAPEMEQFGDPSVIVSVTYSAYRTFGYGS